MFNKQEQIYNQERSKKVGLWSMWSEHREVKQAGEAQAF